FNNPFVLVVRGDDAKRLNLQTISDLKGYAPQWRIGVGFEFPHRPDGLDGLLKTYGLSFHEREDMNLGQLYSALNERRVDVVVGSDTDSLIQAYGFKRLRDDRHYFAPYDAVPVVREQTLTRYPKLREALSDLRDKISGDDIRQLNYAWEREHHDLTQLVAEF